MQGTLPTHKASALKNLTSLNCLIIKENGYEQFFIYAESAFRDFAGKQLLKPT